ncbi:monosaccharide ABC transporter ATP-binding protein (CUT2 family) [Muricomes intestini]|mgnify:CR=1 FL=1|uniref:Monosaccharide ABC transporter ATP-binding protein (CUT2 family) n=1 Tax=Muricomes intestini TaxID=1796634 RepID=A0A4R3K5K6_9FIRM|nr:sugar ABC transporter ATP-binding protein [Muricomes intestini]TCS78086.1 monosaccharide ABC transporter ATP-binding protein (CUT2 family) [Muricomes intestini]
MAGNDVILSLKHISKSYPGVQALDDVSIDFYKGEIHCIIGENGAGKSTFIKMASGANEPDSGTIEFEGCVYNTMSPKLSKELGIEVVYQEFNLAEDLSVAENMYLGNRLDKCGVFQAKTVEKRAAEVFERIKVNIDCKKAVKDLSVSYMQFVEIAKALAKNLKVLILDEPTAPLTEDEVDKLLDVVLDLKEQGYTIIYISHRLPELFRIGDRVTVLRDGKKIITEDMKNMDTDKLITYMVGRKMSFEYPKRNHEIGEVIFEAQHVTSDKVNNISFKVRAGEILGIGGLVGAGRTELLRAIFGADIMLSGAVYLKGEKLEIRHPADAVAKGMGFVTEDRKRQGLLLEDSICHNISLAILKKISRLGVVDIKREQKYAEKEKDLLRIKTPTLEAPANSLSGGNQQKVVLAKWLAADCRIIFMDEPTRGVDVGAKQEIYKLMNELAEQGIAIVIVSSEMEELMGMSERIMVMHEGKSTGELRKSEFSEETVMQYASGLV